MKLMLKNKGSISIILVVILSLVFIGLAAIFFTQKKCQSTVKFSVGAADSRFKISDTEVKEVAKEAADRWNSQGGGTLIAYDPAANLKIELVYDNRQADIDALDEQVAQLKNSKESVDSSKNDFENLVSAYQAKLDKYNSEVGYWNSRGGAPTAVYNNLQAEKSELDGERQSLIKMSELLNIQANDYNLNLDSLKQETEKRKNLIITQGLYIPSLNKIEIYTFGNKDELRLVLMHEMGHALGLDHEQNSKSLMYYLLSEQDVANPVLSPEDKTQLGTRCSLKNPNFYYNLLKITKSLQ